MTLLAALSGTAPVGHAARWVEDSGPALRLEIWYPARHSDGPFIPYLREAPLLDALDAFYRSADSGRGWQLDRQAAVELRVPALADAAPEPGRHPVVLFAHGRAASALQNTTRVADLASHGYIVVALEHPGTSLRAPRPDGGAIAFDASIPEPERIERAWADLSTGLERLGALGPGDPLTGVIDLGHVGAMGRAFGASVVALGASRDPRIAAVASLGGDPPAPTVAIPVLQLSSATAPDRGRALRAGPESWHLVVAGTGSTSYSDTPYLPWIVPPPASFVGTIDRARAAEVIGACIARFFDEQLRDRRGALEGTVERLPEVTRFGSGASR